MHLLRNAMDHGIEKPDERLGKSKPEAGRIEIVLPESFFIALERAA